MYNNYDYEPGGVACDAWSLIPFAVDLECPT